MTNVLQNASRARSFTFDSFSRLVCSSNPETASAACPAFGATTFPSGTVTYTFWPHGPLHTKTDARSTITTYAYDALLRGKTVSYSNGDPTVSINYDEANCLGLSSCQNIGHRTSTTDAAGSESWSYQVDLANHRSVHKNQRTTNSITKPTTYVLDYAGNVTQATYPTGRVVNYAFDNAGRPSSAADGSNGITYATGFKTSPGSTCAANVTCYTPQGTFYALSIGQTASFNGVNLTHIYNNRLQPLEFKASSTAGNAIDVTYSYADPLNGNNNAGHVFSITNNLDGTRSQTFTLDQLNRITSGQTTSTFSTSSVHCWGETYTVDAWGNLQSIAATTNSAYNGCVQESGFAKTADSNNHLSGFSYDAAGNTTNDGTFGYTWDGESQLKTANGVTYSYDVDGRRVSKSNGKLYWYGSGGEILAETDAAGNNTAEYLFFGGKRVAMIAAGSNPIYYIEDMLGTSRVIATNTGTVCYDADFYPFGGERPYTNTCPQNYKFEGRERDVETSVGSGNTNGNDDFGARYYSNRFGRWLSADWSAVPSPVPYANLTNPQTLNLYSMAADDPESFADLDGHSIWRTIFEVYVQTKKYFTLVGKTNEISKVGSVKAVKNLLKNADVRNGGERVVVAETEAARDAMSKALSSNKKMRPLEQHGKYPEHTNPQEGPFSDVHVETKQAAKDAGLLSALGPIFAPYSDAASQNKDSTPAEVGSAALWDVAKAIDPIFITDGIEWLAGLSPEKTVRTDNSSQQDQQEKKDKEKKDD